MVTASRQFVCIRPATYESAAEAKLLKSLFKTRSGELENTLFAVLDPTGKKTLVPAQRGPKRAFRDSAAFAARLETIAAPYSKGSKKTTPPSSMPWLSDLRLALNVAACDQLPLLVVLGDSKKELDGWEKKLSPLFWSDELIGRMHCVAVLRKDAKDPETTEGTDIKDQLGSDEPGVLLVAPETYGRTGQGLTRFAADADAASIKKGLVTALEQHQVASRDERQHLRAAARKGIHWKSELPVTDPGRSRRRRGD